MMTLQEQMEWRRDEWMAYFTKQMNEAQQPMLSSIKRAMDDLVEATVGAEEEGQMVEMVELPVVKAAVRDAMMDALRSTAVGTTVTITHTKAKKGRVKR